MLRTDTRSRQLIESAKSPGEAVANLHAADGELGAAARAWLDVVSYRLQNGLDIWEPTNAEAPEILMTSIRRLLLRPDRAYERHPRRASASASDALAIRRSPDARTCIFRSSAPRMVAARIRGFGVSAGTCEGIARVVHDVSGFDRLRQGDILVTGATTAAFNVVLPLLGVIVTDRGGMLSHTAIVAREYHIPAVIGSRNATRIIPDGARIRVDGSAGEAVIL